MFPDTEQMPITTAWKSIPVINASAGSATTSGHFRTLFGAKFITCFVVLNQSNTAWMYCVCASENPFCESVSIAIVDGLPNEVSAMRACDALTQRLCVHLALHYTEQ